MNLVVFLMRNMSLAHYERIGMFEREMALYREHARHGVRTALVTYGGREDLAFAPRLPGIKILCNWPGWPREVYERRLVWLHAPWLWRADVVKADQTDGAEVAVWSARRWRKPVVARSGYSFVDFQERAFGPESPQAQQADRITRMVYRAASRIVVTTPDMARQATERYAVPEDRVTLIPNYVDTRSFAPDARAAAESGRLCTVGRLEPQKNYAALIRALEGKPWTLEIIGNGGEEVQLRALACQVGVTVHFTGGVPHPELPLHLRRAQVFVLPSFYEGHPKTLLEAMACGMAVLGTNVPGIREVIRHGETGWLTEPSEGALAAGLRVLLDDAPLRQRLGIAARRQIVETLSLPYIAEQERVLFERLNGERKRVASEGLFVPTKM